MKNIISFLILFFGLMFFANDAFAQEEFNLGGGLVYGTEVEAVGLQVNGNYSFSEQVRGAADIAIYFPDQPDGGDYSFWTFNANVHYLFHQEDGVNVYGLGGLNYANQEVSGGGVSFSNSEVGLNLGAGAEYGVDFGSLYAELKYVLSDFDQLVLGAGVRFNL